MDAHLLRKRRKAIPFWPAEYVEDRLPPLGRFRNNRETVNAVLQQAPQVWHRPERRPLLADTTDNRANRCSGAGNVRVEDCDLAIHERHAVGALWQGFADQVPQLPVLNPVST